MNDKNKKPTFQTPKFQQNSNEKRFKERILGENADNPNRPTKEKSQKNSLLFSDKKPPYAQQRNPKPRLAERINRQQRITESAMDNARGTGKVKVVVKSTAFTDQVREKKTGPLSPRAPEKIKKNRAEEMKVYGEEACLALFAKRPESIVRVWATVEMAHKIGEIFSYLAANKKVYHVVDNQELTLVSGTEHHGSICMLVKKVRPFTLSGYLTIPRQQDCVVVLDDIKNAHNIGGIIRTCAVYGVKSVIVDDPELLNSAAAMRVAEGGMEYINALQTSDSINALEQLRQAGYQIVHTTTDKKAKGINKLQLREKVAFVLTESPMENIAQGNDDVVNFSFANPLKSGLNTAVQTGILLAKYQILSHR